MTPDRQAVERAARAWVSKELDGYAGLSIDEKIQTWMDGGIHGYAVRRFLVDAYVEGHRSALSAHAPARAMPAQERPETGDRGDRMPTCPRCGGQLVEVANRSAYLNDDQAAAQRAGDFYCEKCPPNGRSEANRYCYWWKREIAAFAVAPYVESLRSALAHDTRGGVKCAKCGEVISTAGCLCGSNTPVTIAPPPATGEAGTRGENEIRAEVIEECAKTCDSVVNDPDTKSYSDPVASAEECGEKIRALSEAREGGRG